MAIARPMPEDAPVSTIQRPAKSMNGATLMPSDRL
jgi:hypothetical protein